jgi:hypothetical protein
MAALTRRGLVNAVVSQTRREGRVKAILFVLGPSGVGKSHLSKKLAQNGFLYVHIDTDRKTSSFAANGFPKEWDEDFQRVNVAELVAALRSRVDNRDAGAVVSFPTVYVFTPEMLADACNLGVTPLLLWGTAEHCMSAAEERIRKKGMAFDHTRYQRLNGPALRAYGRCEYDTFRVHAFRDDGSRFPDGEWVAGILRRTTG